MASGMWRVANAMLCLTVLWGDVARADEAARPLQRPGNPAHASPPVNASTPEDLALALSDVLYDAIPRRYEKKKDWGKQKRITTGLRTDGAWYKFKIHRRKKEVDHGTWKQYRVWMVDPEKNLAVRIEDLRSLDAGRLAFTLQFAAHLEGWAQMRKYNRGVHLITLTAEGNTRLRLAVDCEVALGLSSSGAIGGVQVAPKVTTAHLDLDDFELTRISKAHGPVVRQLGHGLRLLIEEELDGPELVAKLNRAIEKKRDRLVFAPGKLLPRKPEPKAK